MIGTDKKAGISTACFYPVPLEESFDLICGKLKYKVCELFLNTESETKTGFLKGIKSKACGEGVKIAAVHPYFSGYEEFLFFTPYKRRTYDSVKLYRMFFEAARFLQADYVIFHGLGARELKFPVEEYAEIFLLISAEAEKYGVELLQENVGAANGFIKELSAAAPGIKFTLDFKHAVSCGYDVLDIIEYMGGGKNIAHIHLNDMITTADNTGGGVSKTEMCRLPFFGNLNYSEIFKKLKDINYTGNFITEVYRFNYADDFEIAESKKKFEEFINNLLFKERNE